MRFVSPWHQPDPLGMPTPPLLLHAPTLQARFVVTKAPNSTEQVTAAQSDPFGTQTDRGLHARLQCCARCEPLRSPSSAMLRVAGTRHRQASQSDWLWEQRVPGAGDLHLPQPHWLRRTMPKPSGLTCHFCAAASCASCVIDISARRHVQHIIQIRTDPPASHSHRLI